MEKYMFLVLGAILGIAISMYVYGVKKEHLVKRIENDREYFSTKRLDDALDQAVKRMQLEMKALGRKLTEDEKNEIIFGFLNRSNQAKS